MKTVSASDLKKAAQRWISNNYVGKCTHLFPSFSDQLNSRNCIFHEGACAGRSRIDCLVTGMPCQAWTRLRFADKVDIPAHQHPGWGVTFADFFGFLQAHEVLGGIAEQVMGFADADLSSNEHLEGHNSPCDMFVARLHALGYFVSTYRLNMSSWLHYPKRDRMYIVYLKA